MGIILGNVTIDASKDYDLCIARKFNSDAPLHTDIGSCCINLLTNIPQKAIVGHGNSGEIITGTGRVSRESTCKISLWNKPDWEKDITGVKKYASVQSLHLYGCETGLGDYGASFLYELSKVIDAPTYGPVGNVTINEKTGAITIHGGWQRATPSQKPEPKVLPRIRHLEFISTELIVVMTKDRPLVIPHGDIWNIEIDYFGSGPRSAMENWKPRKEVLASKDAASFLRFVAFDRPFTPPGRPLAILTATLRLTFKDGTTRQFDVLNNRLVNDSEFRKTFYYTMDGFEGLLH